MNSKTQTIGCYDLLEPLGRGGMGVVFRARNRKTGEIVALKTIRASGELEIESIRREIRILARIGHPGIVHIVAEGVHKNLPWYAMDFVEGVTLRNYFYPHRTTHTPGGFETAKTKDMEWWTSTLGQIRNMTDSEISHRDAAGQDKGTSSAIPANTQNNLAELSKVVLIIRRICFALAYLHGEGIVHRDLKPENIMVTSDGEPVLVDFGLMTRFIGEMGREALSVEHGGAGTVTYMSPEQIKGELVDARGDLYALGCILYELLVGYPPFRGADISDIVQGHLYETAPPPSDFRSDVVPELDDLVTRLLAKEPQARVGHADVVATMLAQLSDEGSVEKTLKPKSYLYRSRCTGREQVLLRLRQYSNALKRGKGGFVLIEGEGGIGKTRVVMEFGRELAREGMLVLTGECTEIGGRSLEVLLKPLQCIADRCQQRGVEETEKLIGRRGKLLAMYEPAMINLPGQDKYQEPVELPPEATRVRLFSYLSETFGTLARDIPLTLLLDDLQWADELVLGFFEHELRTTHFENVPLVIIGTYRSESVEQGLRTIIETPGVENITLDRLSESSIAAIVGDMLAMWPPPEFFCSFLNRKSEGNPLFVSEYLRVAIETGLLFLDPRGIWQLQVDVPEDTFPGDMYEQLPLPSSLQGLLERRLECLSPATRMAVDAAVVIGREANILLLWQMTGFDDEQILDVVDELLRYHIMERRSSGTVRFSHARICEVARAQIEERKLRELHRKVAESMELIYAGHSKQFQAELGAHWENAGETDKACICYLSAAQWAKDRYDHSEAVRLYGAYLELLEFPTRESLMARIERGDIFEMTGQNEQALEDYTIVFGLTDDEKLRAACMRKKATILEKQGDVTSARKIYQEALEHASAFPLEQARILNSMAFLETKEQRNFEDAVKHCEQAFQLVASFYPTIQGPLKTSRINLLLHQGIPKKAFQIMGQTVKNFGVLYHAKGDLESALEFLQKSLAISEEIGDRQGVGEVSGNIGFVCHDQGDLERALTFHKKHLSISEEIGLKRGIGIASSNIGLIYRDRGELDLALKFLQKSIIIFEEIGDRRCIGIVSGNMGLIYRDRGELTRALNFFRIDCDLCEEVGDRQGMSVASGNMGITYRDLGDLDRALTYLQKDLAISEEISDRLGYVIALGNIGNVYREKGNLDQALDNYQKSLAMSKEFEYGEGVKLEMSEIYRLKGDHAHALILNNQAMKIFTTGGYELRLGDCWCLRAELTIDSGDLAEARHSLDTANRIYLDKKGGEYSWRLPLIALRLAIAELKNEFGDHQRERVEWIIEKAGMLVVEAQNSQRILFSIEAYFILGIALKVGGRSGEAHDSFTQALTLARKKGYNLYAQHIYQELESL